MRLFIAVLLDADIKGELLRAEDILRSHSISGSFTLPENLHMTLLFIGEADGGILNKTIETLNCMRMESTDISLNSLGCFKREEGELYWLGLKYNKVISDYVKKLSQEFWRSGVPFDDKPYKAHITLGRKVIIKEKPLIDIYPYTMRISKVSLMSSERVKGKLCYKEIRSFECI